MSEALLALAKHVQILSRAKPETAAIDAVRRRFGVWVLQDPGQVKLREDVLVALALKPMSRKEIEENFGLSRTAGRRLCGLLVKQRRVTMRKLRTGPHTNTTIYCVAGSANRQAGSGGM